MHFIDKQKEIIHKPTMLVSNHQSAFTDPIVIAASKHHRRANFLVRGDIFKKPVARYILTRLNQIPIYRARDLEVPDMKKLAELNDKTFEETLVKLKNSEYVIIFPEGDCIQEKRLRPVRKGAARMAFQFLEREDLDLQILPVGLTYTGPLKNQEDVFAVYGDTISVRDYWHEYQETKARAVNKLTKDIQKALDPLIVSLPRELETIAESATRLVRYPDPISPWFVRDRKYYDREKKISLIAQSIVNEGQEDSLTVPVEEAVAILDKHGVNIDCVREIDRSLTLILPALFFGVLCIPGLFWFGIADKLAERIMKKVRAKEFQPSIRIGSIGFLYPIFLLIPAIPLCVLMGWLGAAITLGLLLSRISYLYAFPLWRAVSRRWKMNSLKHKDPTGYKRVKEIREQLIGLL